MRLCSLFKAGFLVIFTTMTRPSLTYIYRMRLTLTLCLILLSAVAALAQPKASVGYSTFNSKVGPYVEIYVSVERASLEQATNGRQSATFTLVFSQGDEIKKGKTKPMPADLGLSNNQWGNKMTKEEKALVKEQEEARKKLK